MDGYDKSCYEKATVLSFAMFGMMLLFFNTTVIYFFHYHGVNGGDLWGHYLPNLPFWGSVFVQGKFLEQKVGNVPYFVPLNGNPNFVFFLLY